MSNRKVRIGIDVGGTFTDAVVVDNATYEVNQKNILRAVATGATELRTKDRNTKIISEEEQKAILAEAEKVETSEVEKVASSGKWDAYTINIEKKTFFGLIRNKKRYTRVIDNEGVIRLQKNNARILTTDKNSLSGDLDGFIDSMTQFTDAGATLPKTYLFFGQKMSDLSGVLTKEQLFSLADMETEFVDEDQKIIVVAAKD